MSRRLMHGCWNVCFLRLCLTVISRYDSSFCKRLVGEIAGECVIQKLGMFLICRGDGLITRFFTLLSLLDWSSFSIELVLCWIQSIAIVLCAWGSVWLQLMSAPVSLFCGRSRGLIFELWKTDGTIGEWTIFKDFELEVEGVERILAGI